MKLIIMSIYLYFFYNKLYFIFLSKLHSWPNWWIILLVILVIYQISKITLLIINYLIEPYKIKLFSNTKDN